MQADKAPRVFAPMEQPRLSSSCEVDNILSLSTIALTWLGWLAFRSKSLWKPSRGHCETKNQLLEYYNVAFDAKVRGFIAKQKVSDLFCNWGRES